MQPITVSVGPLAAADDNGIAESQTTAGAANLTLNGALVTGGVAILDKPRRVIVTSGGNDTNITFTITGTTFGGQSVVETITGASGAAASTTVDFLTVTQVRASGATSLGGVIVGTNGVAGSRWVRMDSWAFAQSAIQVDVSGTVNYTVQTTMDDPNSATNPVSVPNVTWLSALDGNIVSKAGAASGIMAYTPTFVRILLNSGTGSATLTIAQFGNVPL